MRIFVVAWVSLTHQRTMKRERKVTVLLKENEYSAFQRYCDEKGCKKSTLLARLMKQHLEKENFPIPLDAPDQSLPMAAQSHEKSTR